MSNNLTTYNEEVKNEVEVLDEQPIEVEEPVAEESAPEVAEKAPKQKKGSWAYRIFSLLLLGLIAAAVILPVSVIRAVGVDSMPLYEVVVKFIKGTDTKLFGFLPCLAPDTTFGTIACITTYVLLLCLVIAAIVLLIDLFAGRKKGAKFAAFLVTFGLAVYTLAVYVTSAFTFYKAELDYYLIGGFGIALLIYFVLCLIKNKKVWYNFVQALLSIAAIGAIAFVLCYNSDQVELLAENTFKKILIYAAAGIAVFVLIAVLFRVNVKKGQPFELVLYILELIAGGIVVYLAMAEIKSSEDTFFAIAAAGIALVQVIMTAVALGIIKKKAKKAQAAEELEATEETPVVEVEEALEAVVYEGGPIPVAMAENAEPVEEVATVEEEPVEAEVQEEPAPVCGVQTADYDYYNSRSFDPFIASLDSEERNQFTELFILRYKGTFEHLPDYVVGGDNKEFFHKFFIYLGQYRDRIPDGLMAKIYHFSTKI